MTWNYRIIKHSSGGNTWLGLHEVYYDDDGKPESWTEDPIIIVDEDEGVEGILSSLSMMTKDVERSKNDIIDGGEAKQPTPVKE